MQGYDILRRPVITEKTTTMGEAGRYAFEVPQTATKLDIKRAVQQAFDVSVVKVNTMRVRGKPKRFGPRVIQQPSWKKAIVTLAPGQTISLFEGV